MASSLRRPAVALTALAVVGGCHLIGGVHDLDYSGSGGSGGGTGAGNPGGGPQGGGGEGGNTGGGGATGCQGVLDVCGVDEAGVCDAAGNCTTGTLTRAKMFGGDGEDLATAMAASMAPGDGGIYLAMHSVPNSPTVIDFGGDTTGVNLTDDDAILAKLDPSTLEGVWAYRLDPMEVNGGDRTITAVAAAPGGGVAIGGVFFGDMTLPGQSTVNATSPGSPDGFVAFIDEDGMATALWHNNNSPTETSTETITSVAVNESYIAALGYTDATAGFTFAGATIPAESAFLLLFDLDGTPLAATSWDCTGFVIGIAETAADLAFDQAGNLWVVGAYFDVNCTILSLPVAMAPPGTYPFILEVPIVAAGPTASFGTATLRSFGASSTAEGHALKVERTPTGMVVAGDFHNGPGPEPMDFGEKEGMSVTLSNNDAPNYVPFIVSYGLSASMPEWAVKVDLTGQPNVPQPVTDLAVDGFGNVLWAYTLPPSSDVAAPFVHGVQPAADALALKLAAPGGEFLWGEGSFITDADEIIALRANASGVYGFGHGTANAMYGATDAMMEPAMNAGLNDVVIYRRDP